VDRSGLFPFEIDEGFLCEGFRGMKEAAGQHCQAAPGSCVFHHQFGVARSGRAGLAQGLARVYLSQGTGVVYGPKSSVACAICPRRACSSRQAHQTRCSPKYHGEARLSARPGGLFQVSDFRMGWGMGHAGPAFSTAWCGRWWRDSPTRSGEGCLSAARMDLARASAALREIRLAPRRLDWRCFKEGLAPIKAFRTQVSEGHEGPLEVRPGTGLSRFAYDRRPFRPVQGKNPAPTLEVRGMVRPGDLYVGSPPGPCRDSV